MITRIIGILVLLSTQQALADFQQVFPDNNLWKEDPLYLVEQGIFPENSLWTEDHMFFNVGDEKLFNQIIDVAVEVYKPMADQNKETLVINKNWKDPTVNANCMRSSGTVTINMYGGLARRPEINPEGFVLVLCHELSHAYGGIPYLRPATKMSAEGQADYAGAATCHSAVMKKLALAEYQVPPTGYMEKVCSEMYPSKKTYEYCKRGLTAGQALGALLAKLTSEKVPDYETPDKTVVKETVLSYPKTIQCRLDTYFNGALHKPRPLCWFKPERR